MTRAIEPSIFKQFQSIEKKDNPKREKKEEKKKKEKGKTKLVLAKQIISKKIRQVRLLTIQPP